MKDVVGIRLYDWVFKDYKYVSDLIEYEGSILVHYMTVDALHHALYYWVEGNDNYNRWLCFEVTIKELYRYVHNVISLRELIERKEQETFYTTDIDKNLTYSNFQMILGYSLPAEYKPTPESYYNDAITELYDELFEEYTETGIYREKLMENSFDLVAEASGSNRYDKTISLRQCKDFLLGIEMSYKNFNIYHVYNRLKEKISDLSKINRIINNYINAADFRIPNVYANSFHISLAPDVIMKLTGDDEIDTLRKELPEKFKNEILNIDLNNDDTVSNILRTYNNDSERKKIFEPFIRVVNNPNINVKYIDKKNNTRRVYERINETNKIKIAPPKEKNTPDENLNKWFLTITVEVGDNIDLSTLSKKDIQSGTLFSKLTDKVEEQILRFDTDKYVMKLKEPVLVVHTHDKKSGDYIMSFEPLGISVKDKTRAIVGDKFVDAVEKVIDDDYIPKKPKNAENKTFFNENVEDFHYKS